MVGRGGIDMENRRKEEEKEVKRGKEGREGEGEVVISSIY